MNKHSEQICGIPVTPNAQAVDRIVLILLVNPDGRARVLIRMETYKGGEPDSFIPHEYLNTDGRKDGTLIGWLMDKQHIPMRFDDFDFPDGYLNDAGVNIMHDDFFGNSQPETRALLVLCGREKPDLILNMHTGLSGNDYFMQVHRPFTEPGFQPIFDALYRRIKTGLTRASLQGSNNVASISDPARIRASGYNLDTALNLQRQFS